MIFDLNAIIYSTYNNIYTISKGRTKRWGVGGRMRVCGGIYSSWWGKELDPIHYMKLKMLPTSV